MKTGESYAAALRHVRPARQADTTPEGTVVFAEYERLAGACPRRRLARAGIYEAHLVTDDRSDDRGAF